MVPGGIFERGLKGMQGDWGMGMRDMVDIE